MVQTLAEAVALVKRAQPALGVKKIAPLVRELYPELEASGVEVSTKLVRAALRQLESEPAAQKADDVRGLRESPPGRLPGARSSRPTRRRRPSPPR